MSEEQKENSLDQLSKLADIWAESKSNRVKLEEYRKITKARLMKQAEAKKPGLAVNAQEREAYAHEEYEKVVLGLVSATELEASSYWRLKEIEMRFETWRTKSANRRAEMGLR